MNINKNLETDLREYCETKDETLFADYILNPLTYMAKIICQKNKLSNKDYEDGIINDMVSTAAVKLPEYYNSEKGTAKCAVYILMSQHLINYKIFNSKQKRDSKRTIYIEDLSEDNTSHLIEVEIDDIQLMKNTLLENKQLFDRLSSKLHKKVMKVILDAIENPDRYRPNKKSFTVSIAKKCKTTPRIVYGVIKEMKLILTNAEVAW